MTKNATTVTTIGSSTITPLGKCPLAEGELYDLLMARARVMGVDVEASVDRAPPRRPFSGPTTCPPPRASAPPAWASRSPRSHPPDTRHAEALQRQIGELRAEVARIAERSVAPSPLDEPAMKAAIRAMVPELAAAIRAAVPLPSEQDPPRPVSVPAPTLQLPTLTDEDYSVLNTRIRAGQVGRPKEPGTQVRIRLPDEVAETIAGTPDQLRQRMLSVLLLAVHHRVDLSALPELHQDVRRLIEVLREGRVTDPVVADAAARLRRLLP